MRFKAYVFSIFMVVSMMLMPAAAIAALNPSGAVPDTADIRITLVNQEPNPVEPGEHLIVRFRIENLGSATAENTKIEIVPDFPFSLAGSETAAREPGTITGMQKEKWSVTATYDLVVDSSSSEGTKQIYVKYSINNGGYVKTGPYNISVKARGAVIGISSFISEPEQILPGRKVNVTLSVSNNARNIIRDLQVNLDLTASTMPFAPLSGAQSKSASYLAPGETQSFVFSIIATPSAASGVYKIPVKMSYSDQIGKNFTRDDLISLIIGGKPSVIALVSEQGILEKGKTGEFTVQVLNSGLVDAKLAMMMINKSPDYELLSPSSIYIGGIDSDDFDTAKVKVYVKSDSIRMPVSLNYMDANNNEYREAFVLEPKVYTSKETDGYGLQKKGITGFVIAGVIIIVGLLVYRAKFRKKHHDQ